MKKDKKPWVKGIYYRILIDKNGGQGRIRTFEGDSRQIYSLLPLTAREPAHKTQLELAKGLEPPTR